MKKINVLIITIIVAIVLLGIEIIIVRKAVEYEPKESTVYAGVNIKAGETINIDMLEKKETGISNIHQQSFGKKEEIIDKKAKVDIFKGEMILKGRVCDKNQDEGIQVLDTNNRLFTVEFKGDQVNGWWLKQGQYVDIIFIPSEKYRIEATNVQGDYGVERIKNVRVAAIIDDKGNLVKDTEKSSTEKSSSPKYISFEVDDKLDEFLAFAKGNGRIEISIIPDSLEVEGQ